MAGLDDERAPLATRPAELVLGTAEALAGNAPQLGGATAAGDMAALAELAGARRLAADAQISSPLRLLLGTALSSLQQCMGDRVRDSMSAIDPLVLAEQLQLASGDGPGLGGPGPAGLDPLLFKVVVRLLRLAWGCYCILAARDLCNQAIEFLTSPDGSDVSPSNSFLLHPVALLRLGPACLPRKETEAAPSPTRADVHWGRHLPGP